MLSLGGGHWKGDLQKCLAHLVPETVKRLYYIIFGSVRLLLLLLLLCKYSSSYCTEMMVFTVLGFVQDHYHWQHTSSEPIIINIADTYRLYIQEKQDVLVCLLSTYVCMVVQKSTMDG